MNKKVLILGAGYAGVEAALKLHKNKKKTDNFEITLIDRNTYHTLMTELHEVAGNRISEDGIKVPLNEIFKYTNVKLVKDEIVSIDYNAKKLTSKTKEYEYDYLIISAGSEPNFYNIPGMKEHSFTLWSYEDAIKIREHIKKSFVLASQEKDIEKRKKHLTFIIGGGGFTGVELVGEFALWFKDLAKEYAINTEEIKLILVEALPNILNVLPEKSIKKATRYLKEKLKVEVLTNSMITKVEEDTVQLKDGNELKGNTIIWTAGIQAASIGSQVCTIEQKGCRIVVDEYTKTQFEDVYAIGDICAFNTGESLLPAMVETAIQTGAAAAKNIIADVRGKEKKKLKPKIHGTMVSIGSYFAVSEIMGRQFSRILSVKLKYLVNIHYLFVIGGFELVIKYLKHEFLKKKQRQFFIARHYSKLTPAFWLVPLRLFLGYSWLKEGWKKIGEDWLTNPMLSGRAADALSTASVTETGERIFTIVAEHTPEWYAWIVEALIVPNALFFQYMIVLTEIGLGLALITGTFTFISGLVALGLNINFLLSTGLYEYNWWYIPAAITMLGGAGRAFGVDYYLMPYLMRQWRFFARNKRFKIFLFK